MLFTCKRLCGHWNLLLLVKQVLAFLKKGGDHLAEKGCLELPAN